MQTDIGVVEVHIDTTCPAKKNNIGQLNTMSVLRTETGDVPLIVLPMGGVRLRVVGTRVLCFAKALKRTEQRDRVIVFDFWNPYSLEEFEDNVEIAGRMIERHGVTEDNVVEIAGKMTEKQEVAAIASSMKMALICLALVLIILILL